ncbi:adenylate cyclase, partial [Nowakowskiella sp. JEL0078]
ASSQDTLKEPETPPSFLFTPPESTTPHQPINNVLREESVTDFNNFGQSKQQSDLLYLTPIESKVADVILESGIRASERISMLKIPNSYPICTSTVFTSEKISQIILPFRNQPLNTITAPTSERISQIVLPIRDNNEFPAMVGSSPASELINKIKLPLENICSDENKNEGRVIRGGYTEKFTQLMSRDRSDFQIWQHMMLKPQVTMRPEPIFAVHVRSCFQRGSIIFAFCDTIEKRGSFRNEEIFSPLISSNSGMSIDIIDENEKIEKNETLKQVPGRNKRILIGFHDFVVMHNLKNGNVEDLKPGSVLDVFDALKSELVDILEQMGVPGIDKNCVFSSKGQMGNDSEDPRVSLFREYLRINTMQPTPDYKKCSKFLELIAEDLEIGFQVFEYTAGKPIIVMTWQGRDPSLPSILLNSHTDVVPVNLEKWNHHPFGAEKINGKIYARGSQDMKCVGMQQVEAVRLLKKQGKTPLRTIHISFVPDEEIGGADGMHKFIETADFAKLNVGFALDEGYANPDDAYSVFYGERAPWWIKIKATGSAGHGSQFLGQVATLQLMKVINKFIAFRESEQRRLKIGKNTDGSPLQLGDVTTTNLTMLKAGVQPNVVPDYAEAVIDLRVAPSFNLEEFQKQVEIWCDEPGVSFEMIQQFRSNACTPLTDTNPWWGALKEVSEKRKIALQPQIFPAATDCRFLRQAGIPAFGVSPMRFTPILLHDHDEFLSEEMFLEG